MSDLHLHVKTEYFEAIKRGEKTEEYRLCNTYWTKRLLFPKYTNPLGIMPIRKTYDRVVIHNAYKPGAENSLVFPWRGWHLKGITHPHFGEDEVTVFAIALESEVLP